MSLLPQSECVTVLGVRTVGIGCQLTGHVNEPSIDARVANLDE